MDSFPEIPENGTITNITPYCTGWIHHCIITWRVFLPYDGRMPSPVIMGMLCMPQRVTDSHPYEHLRIPLRKCTHIVSGGQKTPFWRHT